MGLRVEVAPFANIDEMTGWGGLRRPNRTRGTTVNRRNCPISSKKEGLKLLI
jgi:hypothetical protein